MPHFGVLSYKGTGHLNPLFALSKKLVARGHRVTFFQHADLEQQVRQAGFEFFPVDVPVSPSAARPQAAMHGMAAWLREVRWKLDRIAQDMQAYLREYPPAIRAAQVDALILGEIALTGPTVAEMLRLPYFIVSTSIPHHFGWQAPSSMIPAAAWRNRLQKELLEVSVLRMRGPVRRRLDRYRRELGLGPVCRMRKTSPELAHITQWPQCLDIPRTGLPSNFFYTGPWIDDTARAPVAFPWERLDGRPLVYASMGTTKKGDRAVFHRIAEACSGLDLQLVISLGGRRELAAFTGLPGDPVVVDNAPQLALLKRAEIVITHAGPATVLEALMHGRPMLALPLTLDQPAVAARLAKLGVAEVLSTENRSAPQIRMAIRKLRKDSRYREAARKLQTQMHTLHGADRAADIMEEAISRQNGPVPPPVLKMPPDKLVTSESLTCGYAEA